MYISYVWYLINVISNIQTVGWLIMHKSFYFYEQKFSYLHNGNKSYESCHLRAKYSKI